MRLVALTGQWRIEVAEVVEYRLGLRGERYAIVELVELYPRRRRPVERSLRELLTSGPAPRSRLPLLEPSTPAEPSTSGNAPRGL